jgi:hypothetical protein
MVYAGNTGESGSTASWEERVNNWKKEFLRLVSETDYNSQESLLLGSDSERQLNALAYIRLYRHCHIKSLPRLPHYTYKSWF